VVVPHVLPTVGLVNHQHNYNSTTPAESSRRYAKDLHGSVAAVHADRHHHDQIGTSGFVRGCAWREVGIV
jgi:hypothetical protein